MLNIKLTTKGLLNRKEGMNFHLQVFGKKKKNHSTYI